MCCKEKWWLGVGALLLAGVIAWVGWMLTIERQRASATTLAAAERAAALVAEEGTTKRDDHEAVLPNESWKIAFKDEIPITFVNRSQNASAWEALKAFWNEDTEKAVDPRSGATIDRKVIKIKVPLGLTSNPPVPPENPLTIQKWMLGKQLYFSRILSSDLTVACATCHDPKKGFTDRSPVSTGIAGKKGGMSAPTVFNSAYNPLQFWDGRAISLEDQSQGPPQNPVEMFDGEGHAWRKVVERVRAEPELIKQFKQVFGTLPTRDTVAKAIATYERTVFSANSIHDRAELAMRKRVEAEETGKLELLDKDYAVVLKDAFGTKDTVALIALGLDPARDTGRIAETAKRLVAGRNLFFNKARCNSCHIGDNFTDNTFHNLGVEAKDGILPASAAGRYGAQPTGHKNSEMFGAFKTPTLRHLVGTAPYMHDGSEKSLEEVIDFYDRGGNLNEYLDVKMRDENAERDWYKARAEGKPYKGPEAREYNGKVIVPLKLNLSKEEKADLVLFLKALQGDDPDSIVADPKKMPR
jgi:cytochrome c peroxidase